MNIIVVPVTLKVYQRSLNLNTPTDEKGFKKMVDDLVDFGQYDEELSDGIKWLDKKAQAQGCSFYDIVFQMLHDYDQHARVKKWIRDRDG